MKTRWRTVLTILFAGGALLYTAGCSGPKNALANDKKGSAGGKGGRGTAPVMVTVATAVSKNVPVQAQVIGAVEAYSTVSIKAQISGQILKVDFREGDFVTEGQLLFTLDPRAIEAQVQQLEANILRDQAQLGQQEANVARDKASEANAKAQLGRAAKLLKEGIVSKEQYDQYDTAAETAAAVVKADIAAVANARAQIAASRAALENQQVQLSYTRIYAPVSGRTGAVATKVGNIVQANTTELTTINQVQPIFVTFALPEAFLGTLHRNAGREMPVQAVADDVDGSADSGKLTFVDNAVDTTTGTIRLKATFANSTRSLWPGQFVRVTMQLENRPNAVVVPSQAIQSGQNGTFVYRLKPDQRVEIRPVVAGERLDQEVVVESGLQAGETVVTEGTLRLVDGARVTVMDPNNRGGRPGRKS
ncbi:MAG: efflux RND transporter periplasmic adaptor subunit [Bryobacterales bacterium]|nr:efflux RND transporter periplasmic adaptor subunit [Bryobacterales bacterium]